LADDGAGGNQTGDGNPAADNSQAEGYATERVNLAQGESGRFTAVLLEYGSVPAVTRSRLYLEALSDALPRIGSVIVVQDGQISPLPLLNLRDAQVRADIPIRTPVQTAPSPPAPARQDRSSERAR
jgi:hypothetical protein